MHTAAFHASSYAHLMQSFHANTNPFDQPPSRIRKVEDCGPGAEANVYKVHSETKYF